MLVSKQNLSKNVFRKKKMKKKPIYIRSNLKEETFFSIPPSIQQSGGKSRPEDSPEFGPAFVAEVVFCLVVSSLGQSLIRCPKPPQ